ncbi:MAG TPA: NAD(P)/FAD-dependent oxidoreductase [Vicinamibacterales bacterium]
MPPDAYDVVIAGGGLAGLTLARQLRVEAPALRVFVAERRAHPVPEAAFKVGESTVEISAHYFHTRLGLAAHLRDQQLEKFGLRYFFPTPDNRAIDERFELGPPDFPPVPSFQVDRGRLENLLLATARASGVEVDDATRVTRVDLGRPHRVELAGASGGRTIEARWLVDASGRHGLLRRQLGLDKPVGHGASASWFRVPSRVKIDDWSSCAAWRDRVTAGNRWLSTNHLMGRGYWVWLIPLGSGSTSIGIVADEAHHPFGRISRFDRAVEWLREFEPQCASVAESHAGHLEDFLALRHFAHGCRQVYSRDRWALVGEAGPFTDPFYSPGSDFIAIGNDFTADLIRRDLSGEDVGARAAGFNDFYLRLFDAFLRVYEGQYSIMGNAQVMTCKVAWDNACYWSIPALLFYQQRLREPAFMASIDDLLRRFFVLHARMQQFLHAWHLSDDRLYGSGFTSVVALDQLRHLQAALAGAREEDETLRDRMAKNLGWLERFAGAIQSLARDGGGAAPALERILPLDERARRAPVDVEPLRVRALAGAT